jgi:hypothetical protein
VSGESLASRFAEVSGGKVVASDLGYRLAADANEVALAMYRLKVPVTANGAWSFKMRRAAGFPNPPFYGNGFFVLGDGNGDEQLIKCGVQFVRGQATIVQGATTKQKGERAALEGDLDATLDVTVTADLGDQTVAIKLGGTTLTAKLERPLKQITRVGFAAWNSVTDFSALDLD